MKKAPNDAIDPLFDSICKLMEEQQLFHRSRLRLSDIAAQLGVNSRYISECIKNNSGYTFTQFINDYRINYVKQQLQQFPNKKIAAIALESGFDNEISFYRTFKNFTGMTPREWLAKASRSD